MKWWSGLYLTIIHCHSFPMLSYACFFSYLYCCIITGQSFPKGKKPPLKRCPEYNQQLFLCWSSPSQWGSVQLLGVSAHCAGPAVRGAIAVLWWQGWQPGCPHSCVTQSAPKAAKWLSTCSCNFFLFLFSFFVQQLYKCLNGWDGSIWRKNRLGGERAQRMEFSVLLPELLFCRINCDIKP